MRLSRYIVFLMVMLIGIAARGQDVFNPTSPTEPNQTYNVKLLVNPAEAGTVSGGGWYTAKKGNVRLTATSSSAEWKFVNWTDSEGNEVSTSASFYHTMSNAHVVYTANFEKVSTMQLTRKSYPDNVFTTTTNTYRVGENVSVSASTYSGYTFINWTDKDGNVVSETRSFTYTTPNEDQELTANYKFDPSSPTEPSATKPKHRVYFTANPTEAGYFNQSNGMQVTEGNSYSVYAYSYSYYSFKNWTINGVEVSTNRSYSATMGDADVNLVANYYFNPSSPNDPSSDSRSHFTLYGNTLLIYKGQTVLYPIYLENTASIKSLDFSLVIPEGFVVDLDGVQTTSRTSAFTATSTMSDNILSVVLSGGTMVSGNNGPIALIPIKATNALEDGVYDINFSSALLTSSTGSTLSVTFRNGIAKVETLEEGDIVAQFTADRYMNRVQFTNTSSNDSKSYLWNFGDGTTSTEKSPMHIYDTPGTYTVKLTVKGIVKEDVAEQSVIINESSTWVSEGDYTINGAVGVRNFVSLEEAITLLSQCTPKGPIVIRLGSSQNQYGMDATSSESLSYLSTLASRLSAAGYHITFATESGAAQSKTIAFTANKNTEDLQTVIDFISQLELNNVIASVNGVSLDMTPIQSIADETVCAETPTTPIMLSQVSSSEKYSVEWFAVVAEKSTLTGYELSGTGDLPSMEISNPGTTNQSVSYNINLKLGDVLIKSLSHKFTVRPLISKQTLTNSSPANGSEVNFGVQRISWTNLNSLATGGYTLTIQRMDDGSMEQNIELNTYYYSFDCKPGATYRWKVTAYGTCDDLVSEEYTFTVKKKSDLTVASITAPSSSGALKKIKISATVSNVGEGSTINTGWSDGIYYSTSANDFANAKKIGTVHHSGQLAPGASYNVEFETTAPDASLGVVYYYLKADYSNYEDEANENNNTMCSDAMVISESFMDENDYVAMKALYNALNGPVWTNEWRINSNAINSTAWPGVTFNEDGRVVAISMSNNNLVGTVPEDFSLPYLTSLDLSRNNIKGNLYKFLSKCPSLNTANFNYCNFEDLSGALPSSIKNLSIYYQNESKSIASYVPQEWTTAESIGNVSLNNLMSYNHSAQNFTAHPKLYIYSTSGSYMGYIHYSGMWLLSLNGDYNLPTNATLVIRPAEGVAQNTKMTAHLNWIKGDANIDGVVDVLDAQHILNRILSRQSGNFNFAASDNYDNDGNLNVQDIVATINLFIEEEVDNEAKARTALTEEDEEVQGSVYATSNGLYLDASQPVAALDITLKGVKASQLSLQLSNVRFQMQTRQTSDGVRVVIISPSGDEIPTGVSRILKISKAGAIPVSVKAADINASNVKIRIDDTGVTDEIDIINPEKSDDSIYDLLGRKVANATRGIYIINGKKIKK